MSTAVAEKEKKAEALLSKRRKRIVSDPLDSDNPVTVQVLGICSSLAVTAKMQPTLVMAISVLIVVVMSNVVISMMRNLIPGRIRIIVQLAVVSCLVILVDQVLHAYYYDLWKIVGVYVGLIITNCIVMGRLEAFAMGNKPYDSMLDGLGNSLGYAWVILAISFIRELLGSGAIFGFPVLSSIGLQNFPLNGLMTSPVGAFIIMGLIIWIQRARNGYVEKNA